MRSKIVIIINLWSVFVFGQEPIAEYSKPIVFPTNPSVYEFTKYGNVPVNEYRGLANFSIPIHNVKLDELNFPLALNYFSGGIKVSEEAGIVGLGWSMNLPAIVQTVKSLDDLSPYTKFQQLPAFTGNPIMPSRGNLHPNYNTGFTPLPYCVNGGASIYSNQPNYFVSDYNNIIKPDGNYICSASEYSEIFVNNNTDTEPDIFTLNLNGVELVIVRDQPNYLTPTVPSSTVALKIINGRTEYKVETYNVTDVTLKGIKITDPNGTQFYFDKVEKINQGGYTVGFMTSGSNNEYFTGAYGGVISKIYKLSKIITNKNKEILFSYSTNTVTELTKNSHSYHKQLSLTTAYGTGYLNEYYDGYSVDTNTPIPRSGMTNYFGGMTNTTMPSISVCNQNQNYYFLDSIVTPNEKLIFSYSGREDYQGMKKLDNIEIKNYKEEMVNKYIFNYSYFGNTSGYDNKRLKLDSFIKEGDKPYSFTYNSTPLPAKSSFSVDYWGYNNGATNTSYRPSFSALGYPEHTDNNQNTFNANLYYTKSASLEKIEYPTGGFTEFEYELHQFDNLLLDTSVPPIAVISTGGGLRIKNVKDFTAENKLATHKEYTYTNGKVIFKKKLVRNYPVSVLQRLIIVAEAGVGGEIFYKHSANVLEANLSTSLGSSIIGQEDYIGYDQVTIKEIGPIDNGKIEKKFINHSYSLINPTNNKYFRPLYFQERNALSNGTLIQEKVYNNLNNLKVQNDYIYSIKTSNINRYGVSISSYDSRIKGSGFSGEITITSIPNFLLTSYPIFANTVMLAGTKTTEYFPSGSKWTLTDYTYDSNNVPTGKTIKDHLGNTFYHENSYMAMNSHFIANNILSLPFNTTITVNGSTKSYQNFFYNTNSTNLNKVEELPEGNPDPTKKVNTFFDLYDDKNNLIQFHRENGVYTSIVWGYNKSLPVAKIENATIASITPSLITAIQTASNTGTEASLLTALTNLRDALPNAMITTYTHKPLIGVSTITDSKGDKLTYNYDTSGRLIDVKDKDGNIVSENEYHFKL